MSSKRFFFMGGSALRVPRGADRSSGVLEHGDHVAIGDVGTVPDVAAGENTSIALRGEGATVHGGNARYRHKVTGEVMVTVKLDDGGGIAAVPERALRRA